MLINEIRRIATKHNFTIIEEDIHKEFFNSWRFFLKKNEQCFLIEKDGRDGWLYFYELNEKTGVLIDSVKCHTYNDNDFLTQCEKWLSP